jgi:hypothetical protein
MDRDWTTGRLETGREPVKPGLREIRETGATREMAVGTLACPDCDAPAFLGRPMSPADPLWCGFCGLEGRVRDFLSLGEPTRATHVVVRVSGLPARR